MKRTIALILCLILCISLLGCEKPLIYRIDLKHAEELALYCWDGMDVRGVNKVPVDLTETMREELERIFHGMLMVPADDVPAGTTVASIRTESFVIGVFREGRAFLQSGNLCCNFWLKERKLDRFMSLISPYIQPKMDFAEEAAESSEEPKEESTVEYVGVSIPGWVPLDGWIAEYELCIPAENLAERKGEQLEDTFVRYDENGSRLIELTAFRENGHTGLNHIIAESEDGELSCWAFQRLCVDDGWKPECFPDHEYPERYTGLDVLSVIYGVESAADMVSVTVSPSSRDHTPEGDAMRERIGTFELTDPEELHALYDIMTGIRSAAQEETKNLPMQEIAVRTSFPGMEYDFCLMRELQIEFANGAVMELLEYDAAYGRFWTPGTNGYLPVGGEDAKILEQLLRIDAKLFADDEGVVIGGTAAGTEDARADPEIRIYVEEYLNAHFRQLPLYEKLTDSMYKPELFLDYNREIALRTPGQVIEVQQEMPVTGTALTDNVFYYLDLSCSCDEQEAARQLVQVMMEYYNQLSADEVTFDLMETEIPEQKLYSFCGMAELHAQRCTELTEGLEQEEKYAAIDRYLDDMLSGGWQESLDFLALGADMWIFDPEVTFDYAGSCNGYLREDCEAAGLVSENGLIAEAQQGSSGMFQYLLIRQGNLWRMQRIGKVLELDEAGEWSDTPLQPAEPEGSLENPSAEEQPAGPEDTAEQRNPVPEDPEDGSVSVDRENWGPPETDQPDPEMTDGDKQTLASVLSSLSYTDEVCDGLHDYTVIAGGDTYYICVGCCAVVRGDRQANLTGTQMAEILSYLN